MNDNYFKVLTQDTGQRADTIFFFFRDAYPISALKAYQQAKAAVCRSNAAVIQISVYRSTQALTGFPIPQVGDFSEDD